MVGHARPPTVLGVTIIFGTTIFKLMRTFVIYISCLISSFTCSAQLLIRNTTVVDVENKKLLSGYNVLIERGIITSVAKNITVPKDAQVIDGTGKYLIPGFVDTHMHFFQSGGIYTRPDIADLRKYKPYAEEIA